MKNKRLIVVLVAIAVIAVFIKLVLLKREFLYAGTIEATKVDVPSRISSVVASVHVQEGDHIKEGQPLLNMSCEDYRLAAQLARDNYERAAKLFQQGSEPKEAYDQTKNKKDEADLKLSWCLVTSPLTGTVLTKYHEPGEMVTPGTRLFTLANLKEIYAYIYVPQPDVARLKLGQKLTGYLPELHMRPFSGTITWISDEAEFTPKNVQTREERQRLVYAVKVSFPNQEEILKPGMTVEVRLPK